MGAAAAAAANVDTINTLVNSHSRNKGGKVAYIHDNRVTLHYYVDDIHLIYYTV